MYEVRSNIMHFEEKNVETHEEHITRQEKVEGTVGMSAAS